MEEAESSWKSVLKRETIASLYEEIKESYQPNMQLTEQWIQEKMVL